MKTGLIKQMQMQTVKTAADREQLGIIIRDIREEHAYNSSSLSPDERLRRLEEGFLTLVDRLEDILQ